MKHVTLVSLAVICCFFISTMYAMEGYEDNQNSPTILSLQELCVKQFVSFVDKNAKSKRCVNILAQAPILPVELKKNLDEKFNLDNNIQDLIASKFIELPKKEGYYASPGMFVSEDGDYYAGCYKKTDKLFTPLLARTMSNSFNVDVFIFHRASQACLARLPHKEWVQNVIFSPDGKTIITLGQRADGVKIWSNQGELIQQLDVQEYQEYSGALFSHRGRWAALYNKQTIYLFDMRYNISSKVTYHHIIKKLFFSPNEHQLFIAYSGGIGEMIVCSLDKTCQYELPAEKYFEYEKKLPISCDGKVLAIVDPQKQVALYNARTGECKGKFDLFCKKIVVSDDGKYCLTLPWGNLYTTETMCYVRNFTALHQIKEAVFTKDASRLITISGNKCAFWNVATGELLGELKARKIREYEEIRTNSYGGTGLWKKVTDTGFYMPPALSHDGKLAAFLNDHGDLYLCDCMTGCLIKSEYLLGKPVEGYVCCFSDDDTELVVSLQERSKIDKLLYSWNVKVNAEIINELAGKCTIAHAVLISLATQAHRSGRPFSFHDYPYLAQFVATMPPRLKKYFYYDPTRAEFNKQKQTSQSNNRLSFISSIIDYINPWQESDTEED